MGAMCEICENRKDLELYIHIPFCIKKCNYCDFLSFPSSAEDREEYVRCLVKEIEQTGIVLNNKDTYIECKLETGRTHQIRVHMASIGHPILGDTVYGPAKCPFKLTGQTLHAKTLGFIHPTTGQYVEFDAELPNYFKELLNKLRK